MQIRKFVPIIACLTIAALCWGQDYQPKFKGDPAKSDSEAAALGFMRTVIMAEKNYKAKKNAYAPSLMDLVGQGSFTRRMADSKKRGDYTVNYKAEHEGYRLTMTPDAVDATHRSFFVDQSGKIKAEEDKAATESSPAA
jgi:hypothetical protein